MAPFMNQVNYGQQWPRPSIPESLRPARRPLSERIETVRASLDHLVDETLALASGLDRSGRWSATHIAHDALLNAQRELGIASLSLGIQEDIEA